MADVLRDLAQAHSELLTRECECCASAHPDGRWPCAHEHTTETRRLLTLEEALEALPVGVKLIKADDGYAMTSVPYTGQISQAGVGDTPREAAYRLLIEASRD